MSLAKVLPSTKKRRDNEFQRTVKQCRYCTALVLFNSKYCREELVSYSFFISSPYFYFSSVWYYAVINEIFSLINAKKQKQLKEKDRGKNHGNNKGKK